MKPVKSALRPYFSLYIVVLCVIGSLALAWAALVVFVGSMYPKSTDSTWWKPLCIAAAAFALAAWFGRKATS